MIVALGLDVCVAVASGNSVQEPAAVFQPVEVKAGTDRPTGWKQSLHNAAVARLEVLRAYYENGQVAIDRYLDAVDDVVEAALTLAEDDADRVEVRRKAMELARSLAERERARHQVGSGSAANLADAEFAALKATWAYHEEKGTPAAEWPEVPDVKIDGHGER